MNFACCRATRHRGHPLFLTSSKSEHEGQAGSVSDERNAFQSRVKRPYRSFLREAGNPAGGGPGRSRGCLDRLPSRCPENPFGKTSLAADLWAALKTRPANSLGDLLTPSHLHPGPFWLRRKFGEHLTARRFDLPIIEARETSASLFGLDHNWARRLLQTDFCLQKNAFGSWDADLQPLCYIELLATDVHLPGVLHDDVRQQVATELAKAP